MALKVGDKIPEATLKCIGPDGIVNIEVGKHFSNKKIQFHFSFAFQFHFLVSVSVKNSIVVLRKKIQFSFQFQFSVSSRDHRIGIRTHSSPQGNWSAPKWG